MLGRGGGEPLYPKGAQLGGPQDSISPAGPQFPHLKSQELSLLLVFMLEAVVPVMYNYGEVIPWEEGEAPQRWKIWQKTAEAPGTGFAQSRWLRKSLFHSTFLPGLLGHSFWPALETTAQLERAEVWERPLLNNPEASNLT